MLDIFSSLWHVQCAMRNVFCIDCICATGCGVSKPIWTKEHSQCRCESEQARYEPTVELTVPHHRLLLAISSGNYYYVSACLCSLLLERLYQNQILSARIDDSATKKKIERHQDIEPRSAELTENSTHAQSYFGHQIIYSFFFLSNTITIEYR